MVQQPFVGGVAADRQMMSTTATASSQQPQQQPAAAAATSLAMPAIIATNQQHSTQAQYSPKANFYQQQLMKNAQQFAGIQQQQQQTLQGSRLNGLASQQQQQEHSPINHQVSSNHQLQLQQQQQQQESLYNGLQQSNGTVRPTPIYAPRPAYYSNQQQQATTLTSPNAAQTAQLYQQAPRVNIQQQQPTATAAYYQQQQQSSPSINHHQQQQQLLSVRQLSTAATANGFNGPSSLSPPQNPLEQQQRQLQHLVLSYQQQQQQQAYLQQPSNVETNQHHHLIQPVNFNESRWSTNSNLQLPNHHLQMQTANGYIDSNSQAANHNQQLMIQQQQPNNIQSIHNNAAATTTTGIIRSAIGAHHVSAARQFSDRDSISTVSRFNQFDNDRRSFTMRSQYTSANERRANGSAGQFGFVELTSEAIKRILGLQTTSGHQSRQPLLGGQQTTATDDQLRRNMSMASLGGAGKQQATNMNDLSSMVMDGNSNQQQLGGGKPNPITVIDSGEDYYFKRRVFSYQLIILRLINFLFSCFVLLSPLVMLLVPKMEPLIGMSNEQQQLQLDQQQVIPVAATSSQLSMVVTHAVGLANKNAQQLLKQQQQQQQQQHHQLQQQQWRISECQSSDCDGPLIGFVIRLILLSIAHWAIFFRSQTVTLPRIDFQRCFLISLASLISLAYWLFFIFRVFDKRYNDYELHYITIIHFAISMLETLILLHYLALVLLELRQKKKIYCLKVVRSPDGQSQYLSCGSLSIQKCAQFVLEKYHRNFQQCSAYSEQLLEFEDELAQQLTSKRAAANQQASLAATSRHHHSQHSRPNSPALSTGHHSHHRHNRSRSRSTNQRSKQQQHQSRSMSSSMSKQAGDEQANAAKPTSSSQGDRIEKDQQQQHVIESASRTAKLETRKSGKRRRRSESNNNNDSSSGNEEDEHGGEDAAPINGESKEEATGDDAREQQQRLSKQKSENSAADQSSSNNNSDATSRLKESSLETVRAANEKQISFNNNSNSKFDIKIQDQQTARRQNREFETESVRSGRSRRSTASHRRHISRTAEKSRDKDKERDRDHHRHNSSSREQQSSRRERSSSRNNLNIDCEEQDEELHDDDEAREENGRTTRTNELEDRSSHQDRQDLLGEHERKLRRRKLRLLATVENAFDRIKQIDINEAAAKDHSSTITINGQQARQDINLDAHQAARTIYPSIARSLQKYLRLTKQTGRHNLQSIYEHLSKCLLYKLNPRAFLEKFINLDPVWQQSETNLFANCRLANSKAQLAGTSYKRTQELEINSWSLVCDTLLSRQIESGTFFLLKQGSVTLLVTVAKLPHLNLSEQVIDESLCRFTINSSPETTPV